MLPARPRPKAQAAAHTRMPHAVMCISRTSMRARTHTDAGVQTDTRNLLRSAGECTEVHGDQRTKTNALNLAGDRIVKYLSHFSDIRGGVAAEGFQLPQRTLKSPRLARVLLLSMHAHAHARHVPASHARGYKHHIQASHAHVPCKHHKHVVLVRRARASRSSLTCTPSAPAQLHTPRILGAH